MGLLTSWNKSVNLVITQGLTKQFTKVKKYGQWVATSLTSPDQKVTYDSVWEYRRIVRGSFKYVGMDYETACECAEAMVTKYTRSTEVSYWSGEMYIKPGGQWAGEFTDINGGSVAMIQVSVNKVAGHMYEVIVQLAEDDAKERAEVNTSYISTLFATEESREYEEFEDEDA